MILSPLVSSSSSDRGLGVDDLARRVLSHHPDADASRLHLAYDYAMRAHGPQRRASGEPYFSHPAAVAGIVADHRLDVEAVSAALLHDVVEDTDATLEDVYSRFGSSVGSLVSALTKIDRLDVVLREASQAENLRRLLIAMSSDPRVLIVKLADRLHNMRTLSHVGSEKRSRIAQDTMDIFAPLAARMGMQALRDELEDLAMRELRPLEHASLTRETSAFKSRAGATIEDVKRELESELRMRGVSAEVSGREKTPCSIWRKMERKGLSFSQLSDVYGFRVIADDEDSCYRALGIVHRRWRAVPGRFKDYVSNPKLNDYRSLHTTVMGLRSERVEMQIRTREMDRVAEYGIAAHAGYSYASGRESGSYRWLREFAERLTEGDTPHAFLTHTRMELFHEEVFCFTPQGDMIALPRGANPIDFAYAVHTRVGDECVGCRVNGKSAPLISPLENGDSVEIVRSEGQTRPPSAWESLAATGKARAAIRRASRLERHRRYAGLGRKLLSAELAERGLEYDDATLDELVSSSMPRIGMEVEDAESVLSHVGRGDLSAQDAAKAVIATVSALMPRSVESSEKPSRRGLNWFGSFLSRSSHSRAIPLRGLDDDIAVSIHEDTGAVPGEEIVGIDVPGEGLVVYPTSARGLKRFEGQPEIWRDLAWDVDSSVGRLFPARIEVTLRNEVGALARVATVIGDVGANIENLLMTERSSDFYRISLSVEVRDFESLTLLLESLRREDVVYSASRGGT